MEKKLFNPKPGIDYYCDSDAVQVQRTRDWKRRWTSVLADVRKKKQHRRLQQVTS